MAEHERGQEPNLERPDQVLGAGGLGETPFRAVVSAADGGLGSTAVVVAEGTVRGAPFKLFAALSGDLTKAVV